MSRPSYEQVMNVTLEENTWNGRKCGFFRWKHKNLITYYLYIIMIVWSYEKVKKNRPFFVRGFFHFIIKSLPTRRLLIMILFTHIRKQCTKSSISILDRLENFSQYFVCSYVQLLKRKYDLLQTKMFLWIVVFM